MLCYIYTYNTISIKQSKKNLNYTYTPTNEKFRISAWFLDTDSVDK